MKTEKNVSPQIEKLTSHIAHGILRRGNLAVQPTGFLYEFEARRYWLAPLPPTEFTFGIEARIGLRYFAGAIDPRLEACRRDFAAGAAQGDEQLAELVAYDLWRAAWEIKFAALEAQLDETEARLLAEETAEDRISKATAPLELIVVGLDANRRKAVAGLARRLGGRVKARRAG